MAEFTALSIGRYAKRNRLTDTALIKDYNSSRFYKKFMKSYANETDNKKKFHEVAKLLRHDIHKAKLADAEGISKETKSEFANWLKTASLGETSKTISYLKITIDKICFDARSTKIIEDIFKEAGIEMYNYPNGNGNKAKN